MESLGRNLPNPDPQSAPEPQRSMEHISTNPSPSFNKESSVTLSHPKGGAR